ncbi:MAG: helix-turn-helix domain-containing protein [Rhodocyclaceae bacterium]|nr:helix-turn-helix domain-containing protein [Rhodocyclaceae bacterium]MCP5308503.1 helix-turn-helix domain-containing protein [Zoogloeaceae bacterium]
MTEKTTGRDRGDGATRKHLLQQIGADFPGNDSAVQQGRMMAAMRAAGSVTTSESGLHLKIMNPSQRVTELRNSGERIDTVWTREPSESGRAPHRQAWYVPRSAHGRVHADLFGLVVLATVAVLLLAGVLR